MKLLIKTFHNFFLQKFQYFFKITKYFFLLVIIFSNNLLAGTESKEYSILDRLPTSIFATINGEVVSIYDLILRSNLYSISANIPIDENFKTNILPDLISGLIDEKIQAQEIKKNNIIVAKDQVNREIENVEKDNGMPVGSLKDYLKANKSNVEILKKQIETSFGWAQLVSNKFRSQIIIQESDTQRIIDNLESQKGKEEYFVEQIFVSFENRNEREAFKRINNLNEQIKKGGDFLSISKQFSDSSSGKLGRIGWTPEFELDPKLVDKIKKIEINKISNPIKGENGYYILNIKDKKIIGEERIAKVSLFQFDLIEENDEILSKMKEIDNCENLEKFSEQYASVDSGSLGLVNFNELSEPVKKTVKKLNTNEISDLIKIGPRDVRIMLCDVVKVKPTLPSKFKIEQILASKKLDTISRQYLTELRANAIIDIKI